VSSSFSSPGAWLRVADAEGVGDALADGAGVAVDAVSVDLEQDRDAVPGAAGGLGSGDPGVQPERHRRMPQVVICPVSARRLSFTPTRRSLFRT